MQGKHYALHTDTLHRKLLLQQAHFVRPGEMTDRLSANEWTGDYEYYPLK